jgi:thiol-disulfide isomerase/thioredoxin
MMRSLAFALALCAPAVAAAAQDTGLPVGSDAPAAVVQTLDGKDVDLATYVGKGPVIIEFWAAWCPNCRELEPKMVALAKQYAGKVTFLVVAVSVNESVAHVKSYAQKHAFPMPVFYDTHGVASGAYDAPATSYVVAIDKAGKVRYTGVGADQDLGAVIKTVLPN